MDPNVIIILDNFFNQFKKREFKIKELLINPDTSPIGLYYLKKGLIREFLITSKGDDLTINIFKPHSLFPIGWILNDSISPHYYEALVNSEVWIAPKTKALEFLCKSPLVLIDLVKRIYMGLDGYFSRIENQMSGNAQKKLISELIIFGKRFGKQDKDKVTVIAKVTEKILASQAGIARETVSRELKKLKEQKLISFTKGTLILNNLSKLEQILQV